MIYDQAVRVRQRLSSTSIRYNLFSRAFVLLTGGRGQVSIIAETTHGEASVVMRRKP